MPAGTKLESLQGRQARALWIEGRRQTRLRLTDLRAPNPDEALVGMQWSGISRGTERLVFEGCVPPSESKRMRSPMQGRGILISC
jgi:hypothetical protein